jgi:collagen beta-1,O-galactosyltransferase
LGRVRLELDKPAIKGIVKPGYSHCTFAYILTRPAIEKLLSTSFEKDIIPVDEFLPAMYIDHPREDVRKRYPKILRAYAFEPPIAFQLSKAVAGSDTEDSDFYETK